MKKAFQDPISDRERLARKFGTIKRRCKVTTADGYKYYGGRGIKCEWTSFKDFFRDMSPTYKHGLTIDRIDTNKNYCKENCKWSTPKEQCRNRRNNHLVTYKNETLCISEWAERFKISKVTIRGRLRKRWSLDKVFSKPRKKSNAKNK